MNEILFPRIQIFQKKERMLLVEAGLSSRFTSTHSSSQEPFTGITHFIAFY